MRSTFKVLFYVNGSKEKNGIVPIMGQVTINGSVAQFSCKLTIVKTMWDAKGNRAKGKSKEARELNFVLDNIKAQIIKHYQRLSDREAFVTAEMVRDAYQGIGTEYETLLGTFDKDNESFKKRIGIDRAASSYKVRVRSRNHLAAFIKKYYKRSDIAMLELTPDFIKEYEIYLSTELVADKEHWISPRFGDYYLQTHYDNIKQMVKTKTGRAMQEKERERNTKSGKIIKVAGCSPIRKGVLLIKSDTTLEDVRRFGEECRERWGITPLQIFLHKDEGHWLSGKPDADDKESFQIGGRSF